MITVALILVGYGAQVLVLAVAQRRHAGGCWARAIQAILLALTLLLALPAINIGIGAGHPAPSKETVIAAYLALQGAILVSLPALILTVVLCYAVARDTVGGARSPR